ncbi:hypothetical protein [Tunturiibacter lichenicola]|uniref:TRAFAC clade GTPase domain-containing protein n=1 Tax=Tunturiibacter lichenicola TaxID=2051959 RepID=UPI003D9BC9D5
MSIDIQAPLRSVLLIGVPDAGKSNFVFRLWLMLHAGTGMLSSDGLPADLDYLNGGGSHLLQGEFAPRTSREVHDQTEIPVRNTAAGSDFKGTLVVPDLPGEQILSVYRNRQWSEDWENKIREGCGCLLLIRVDSKELIVQLDWMSAASHFGGPVPDTAPEKDEEGKDKPPTQVVLVDWLQFLRKAFTQKVGGTYRPRIGIVVSAWDLVPEDQKGDGPAKWVEDNLPLLSQYVSANYGDFDFEYFGVSVTEGDFDADPDFKAEYIRRDPRKAGEVVHSLSGEIETTHDVTLPVAWALGLPMTAATGSAIRP